MDKKMEEYNFFGNLLYILKKKKVWLKIISSVIFLGIVMIILKIIFNKFITGVLFFIIFGTVLGIGGRISEKSIKSIILGAIGGIVGVFVFYIFFVLWGFTKLGSFIIIGSGIMGLSMMLGGFGKKRQNEFKGLLIRIIGSIIGGIIAGCLFVIKLEYNLSSIVDIFPVLILWFFISISEEYADLIKVENKNV